MTPSRLSRPGAVRAAALAAALMGLAASAAQAQGVVNALCSTDAPWSEAAMSTFANRLAPYETTKGLFKVPVDWDVDGALITDLIQARMAELGL